MQMKRSCSQQVHHVRDDLLLAVFMVDDPSREFR
jgi:hypothetical protein